ncbi:glucose-6-phosphate 1-dehydrogenase [Nasonia vitripennis]|uniref:Glucose-6-phosphate 1-dehydrogenase n=1 Tax=Nasonia vitripennis TaxID=7425 RepID=A0A7M7LLA0_NASVI|nr:glucose-6-phosphate 1-dehydrogenase [Nasonia vitripennis]
MTLKSVLILCFLATAALTECSAFVPHSLSTRNNSVHHTFVLLGASGDLARREIYPALWYLYRDGHLLRKTEIFGYARSALTIADIRDRVAPFIQVRPQEEKLYNEFWSLNRYINGSRDADTDYDRIDRIVSESEENETEANRIFYLALPPATFPSTASQIKRACMAKKGSTKVVVEKPFGRDSESSEELSEHLKALFTEDQIYRMDHFLGYEMVQNLLSLRFANRMFSPSWNKDNIAAIEVDFKENFGIEGRGGYFDSNGMIRDVMQNHLLQIVSLVAMEKPVSVDPDDIRDAKVELLKKTRPIVLDDVVIGQYVANPESADPRERIGYRDDPTVKNDSITATFALTVLKIDNERWTGVPFIIRAGKGLNINRTDVIIQYKNVDHDLFDGQSQRNELVIRRVGKTEALQAKLTSKTPGITSDLERITIDFDYTKAYPDLQNPGAYERLLLDVFRGTQLNFVRSDELSEAWRIFTPALHEIENRKIRPIEYKFGTTGPVEADEMEKKNDFL